MYILLVYERIIIIIKGFLSRPFLFTMHASKLFEVVKNHLPNIHAYADDTQKYLSFKPDSTAGWCSIHPAK